MLIIVLSVQFFLNIKNIFVLKMALFSIFGACDHYMYLLSRNVLLDIRNKANFYNFCHGFQGTAAYSFSATPFFITQYNRTVQVSTFKLIGMKKIMCCLFIELQP